MIIGYALGMKNNNVTGKVKYRFAKHTYERQRDGVVLNLRKDGFFATREYDREERKELLITNATFSQVSMACGRGGLIHE